MPFRPWTIRQRPLTICDDIAEIEPDVDPGSIVPLLISCENEPLVQFSQPLPSATLEALAAALAARPSLRLRTYGRSLSPSLDYLRYFRHAHHLAADSWFTTDFGLLAEFRNLQSLELAQTKSTAVSLAFMRDLQKLTKVGIEAHDRDFNVIGDLPRMRHLYLRCPRVKSVACLAGHGSLSVFEMDFGGIRDLAPLSDVPGLRGLGLHQIRKLDTVDLDALAGLKRLEAANLGALRNVERLRFLSGRPSKTIRYLTLERLVGLQTLEDLGSCESLEELYLDHEVTQRHPRSTAVQGVRNRQALGPAPKHFLYLRDLAQRE